MEPIKIAENVYWVGGIDWNLRSFHGYLTQRGSTYNAYLIIDDKITLIDTVKHYLYDEMIQRISKVVNPADIDYIISNHVEMDHSGSLPKMAALAPNAELIASPNGVKGLNKHYGDDLKFTAVKTGDTLSIGKRTLAFVQTPMVHWPDNMVTYCPQDKILFSNDAFGQHIATPCRFDDECPYETIIEEARKYYANIVLPYDAPVRKALAAAADLDISIIAPSHGVIWRTYLKEILEQYTKWSSNTTEEKATIVYDTMWESTERMAYAVQEAFTRQGIPARMCHLQANHISDIMTDIMTSRYICIGTPTLNNNMLPTVAAFLTYMSGLKPQNRIGLAFGSHGWGGQGSSLAEDALSALDFQMLTTLKHQYVPADEDLLAMTDAVSAELEKIEGV